MIQTISELLFAFLLAIGVPLGIFVGTFIFMAIVVLLVSIPIILCHWAWELLKWTCRPNKYNVIE